MSSPLPQLLILTDARGFTTCCTRSEESAAAEVSRLGLLPPISVFNWKRVNQHGPRLGWKLIASFTWDGLLGGNMRSLMKTLDENFRDWEASALGFGYGTGEPHTTLALKVFMDLLSDDITPELPPRSYDYRKIEIELGSTSAWFLINLLTHQDIIEYGTSPRFGWLTTKGEALRDYINSKTLEELLEVLYYNEDYTVCFPDACNCGPHGYLKGLICSNPFWGT